MTNVTLSVPKEMKKEMDKFKEINWSEVARQAFMQKLRDMETLQRFKSKSDLTKKEAVELGKKLNKDLARKYKG